MRARIGIIFIFALGIAAGLGGCARREGRVVTMEATGYCGCGECCGWERGRWRYLKLNFWNRYVSGSDGVRYTGRTASGTRPHPPRPGLVSIDSLRHPWMIPPRIAMPWLLLPQKGTLAADTDYYPFGTMMHVPGWGWGIVEDRGGAIKGPGRIDTFHRFHWQANRWGRRNVEVRVMEE